MFRNIALRPAGTSGEMYERLFVKIKNSAFYDIFGAKYAYLAKSSIWHVSKCIFS